MTEAGWSWILKEITTMPVEMPKEPMTAAEAKAWIAGYLKAQSGIRNRIEEMSKGQRD